MTVAVPSWTAEVGPCDRGVMRAEPLDEAARRLSALADEIDATRGRVALTRPDRPDLVLLSRDELETLEETLFWCVQDLDRVRAGEPLDEEPGPPMTGDELRATFAHLLDQRGE